jgi:dynein assembly factor 1, axonemal
MVLIGFGKIELMENFPHLKCLYFEGNAITTMAGLETNVELLSLYLHENCINQIAHISNLKNLKVLNLSDNCIRKIEGLEGLNIDTLYLARNRIGFYGVEDLKGLLECKSITCVDLQQNNIDDEAVIPEVFEQMPDMKVLYLQNNKVVKKIKNYRKTLTVKLPQLVYLDDRPVFKDDRRNAEAFSRGGIEEERKERTLIKKEQNEKDEKNRQAFRDMLEKAKEERKAAMAAMKTSADKAMADDPETAPEEAPKEKSQDDKKADEQEE